jgi:hypothetical protein
MCNQTTRRCWFTCILYMGGYVTRQPSNVGSLYRREMCNETTRRCWFTCILYMGGCVTRQPSNVGSLYRLADVQPDCQEMFVHYTGGCVTRQSAGVGLLVFYTWEDVWPDSPQILVHYINGRICNQTTRRCWFTCILYLGGCVTRQPANFGSLYKRKDM